ncbi:sensor histidine kinase [Kribbella sp. CA-293567]|uniref:sensor histidine kinase n=1 Tax=Kribbella sp. CA-293567 TaxID=3002436 RepID=UPI0022DE03C5|nr:HAMP domain-containing sensor histidine kinase [Kribbella sp. CA-293567]WBQ06315.1 HAMP domain-containing sensor histidine kinase [Kribbella sp. CA-293567]
MSTPGAAVPAGLVRRRPRLTVRLRLTLSYALLLVLAGGVIGIIIYAVMRFVPNYPLTAANPRDQGPVATRGEILDTVVELTLYALALLAAIGMGAGWIIAGRMLRPLQEITAAARLAASGSLDHRIRLAGPRDEFTDLSDTFDEMLTRLERSFTQYRRFAANASHELRTPHAVMKTMLEVAIADPEHQDVRELAHRLDETNQRGIDIVESLLALASLGNRKIEFEPLNLATVARQVAEELRPEAEAAGVTLGTELQGSVVLGNEILIRQLVQNVVQNAIRHNLPAGGTALLRVLPDGRLTVANSGEVLDPAKVATLTEPFVRGGRLAKRPGQQGGHGLGLALVEAIAIAHGGSLDLTSRPAGGLDVSVQLRAASGRTRPAETR